MRSWWPSEFGESRGNDEILHAISTATGRHRNVRLEQTLIKFSGVQLNSLRTG